HNLTDAAALGLCLYAITAARKPATRRMTYGYHRVGILAALANAITLDLIAASVVWEAIARLRAPVRPDPTYMITVAAIAVVLNGIISMWLREGRSDLNIRSAYLHMVGDAVSAFGVVLAGVITWYSGQWW